MSNRMNYQGGSVLGFAIVGVLLAVALVGGLYWLQSYSDGIEKTNQEIAAESKNTSDEKKDEAVKSNDKESTPSSDDATKDETPSEDTSTSDDTNAANDETKVLPQTGPADAMWQFIGLSVLTFATVGYVRSRSPL